MGRGKRIITKTKEIQAEHLRNVRKALIDPSTNREMVQWKFANLINVSEPQLRLYEKCKSDIPISLMELITKHPQIIINGFHVRLEYLLGTDECMTLHDCVPHSQGEFISIVKDAQNILASFGSPIEYQTDLEQTILHLLDINGFSPCTLKQITNKTSFVNYMEYSIRNSIEFYMNNLN